MEHHIDIEETSDSNIVQRIDKNILELPPSPDECFIYKVNQGLRNVKPKAYEPVVVSIGPYHNKNERLSAMKQHKLRYLRSLLKGREEAEKREAEGSEAEKGGAEGSEAEKREAEGSEGSVGSVEKYVLELRKLEGRARKCYVDPIDDHLKGRDDFVEMMLLDGCFIIEYFHKIILGFHEEDPILKVPGMNSQICLDVILLENQLPYFVLSQLFDMTNYSFGRTLRDMATLVFALVLPQPRPNFIKVRRNYTRDNKHLLDLVYILCTPSSEEKIPESNDNDEVIDPNLPLLEEPIAGNDDDRKENFLQMRSVVELQEAGVEFKKVGKIDSETDSVSLFDINFNDGLLEIPCFTVADSTDTLFRNFIAYEQHSDVEPTYFTDFQLFMDRLISSERDVKLLRLEEIVVNWLGEDKVVSELFNRLGDGVMFSPSSFYYSKECIKMNRHCKKRWNQIMAKLRSDYFNNPWASVSTFAAGFLLLLTVVQTVVALITLFT